MSAKFWRIATDTPNYTADDRTGEGAKRTGGRWNAIGTPMIYTSATRALACLETIVHLNSIGLPLNRYLVEITIPRSIVAAAEHATPQSIGVGWEAHPAGKVSIEFGTKWIAENRSALLYVPSVIVEEEHNILINPNHPDITSIRFTKQRPWRYDHRLTPLPRPAR